MGQKTLPVYPPHLLCGVKNPGIQRNDEDLWFYMGNKCLNLAQYNSYLGVVWLNSLKSSVEQTFHHIQKTSSYVYRQTMVGRGCSLNNLYIHRFTYQPLKINVHAVAFKKF